VVNVVTVLTVPMVPVDYVIAHSSKILQHVYTLPNTVAQQNIVAQRKNYIHKKLITNMDSHRDPFQLVPMSVPLLNSPI